MMSYVHDRHEILKYDIFLPEKLKWENTLDKNKLFYYYLSIGPNVRVQNRSEWTSGFKWDTTIHEWW